MTGAPEEKCRRWEHAAQILFACFFEAKPIYTKIPLTAASRRTWRWPGNLRRIQVWQVLETHHCTLSHASLWCKQCKPTLLWQQLVSFIQIQCNWLHPGGTPGSNILIKLICEILTMWVFRWLVIWCERSLCFHWKDTGGAGTCFGETLQKIIAVELSWVRAITNDSVCLSPHESQILHRRFFFPDGLSKYIFLGSSFVSNLLWMIRNSHQLDYDNVSFRGNEKVSTALAFIQMFFSSCTPGKYMCINSVRSKIPQHGNLFWNMLLSFTFSVGPKWKLCFAQ